MRQTPAGKYVKYSTVNLTDREWPSKTMEKAPIWCSVDLRDGNQALVNPMDLEKKLKLFRLLVEIGFKEIEIGFPSASQTEFNFLRKLIDDGLIPNDVTIQVLVQAREHLIERTFEALDGAKKAVIHLYNSTSVAQRKIVFRKEKSEIIELALQGVDMIKSRAEKSDIDVRLEYSPESFTGTEIDFAIDICNAVTERWGTAPDRKVIINLPATVELATPNIYADQIEYMGRKLRDRENVLISVHTHNDRGTAVAASELALLAGADRVEGTLLGNGERTGNVDILTLALNMYTQGIDPEIYFDDVNEIINIVEEVTEISTHIRHPYVGELVYTAFSGSHQDAINKGIAYQNSKENPLWEVPYLPIDPNDVGRTYEDIIRINSQSGKGGVAYILEHYYGFELPKAMHPEVSRFIQRRSDALSRELSKEEIFEIFEREFLQVEQSHIEFLGFQRVNRDNDEVSCILEFLYEGEKLKVEHNGNGILSACKNAIVISAKEKFDISNYTEMAKSSGSDAQAIAYIQIQTESFEQFYGVGIDTDTTKASIKALFSALNRAYKGK